MLHRTLLECFDSKCLLNDRTLEFGNIVAFNIQEIKCAHT